MIIAHLQSQSGSPILGFALVMANVCLLLLLFRWVIVRMERRLIASRLKRRSAYASQCAHELIDPVHQLVAKEHGVAWGVVAEWILKGDI
jgi:hypothetical protein